MLSFLEGRLITCQRLTNNSSPKLSLTTLYSPLKRRDSRSAGYTGGPVNYPSRFISWVYRGESIFQVQHGKSLKKSLFYGGLVGFEPTTPPPKNTCPADDAIC